LPTQFYILQTSGLTISLDVTIIISFEKQVVKEAFVQIIIEKK